jgi:hypothetical protein
MRATDSGAVFPQKETSSFSPGEKVAEGRNRMRGFLSQQVKFTITPS